MRKNILIVGANGAVGKAATQGLSAAGHTVFEASRQNTHYAVDLHNPDSIQALFMKLKDIDAVIATAGGVHFGTVPSMTSYEFRNGLNDKLMGQINLALVAQHYLRDNGSITLTSGIISAHPIAMGANATAINRAIEGFAQAATGELQRGIRINVVSPTFLEASADVFEPYFPGFDPVSDEKVAQAYRRSVDGIESGKIYTAWN